jgi:hypothetical protein
MRFLGAPCSALPRPWRSLDPIAGRFFRLVGRDVTRIIAQMFFCSESQGTLSATNALVACVNNELSAHYLRVCVKHGASLSTGLRVACAMGHARVIKDLLAMGADPRPGVVVAQQEGHLHIVELLERRAAAKRCETLVANIRPPSVLWTLRDALEDVDVLPPQVVSLFLDYWGLMGADLDAGARAAASLGRKDLVVLLLGRGADANRAVEGAIEGGQRSILLWLLNESRIAVDLPRAIAVAHRFCQSGVDTLQFLCELEKSHRNRADPALEDLPVDNDRLIALHCPHTYHIAQHDPLSFVGGGPVRRPARQPPGKPNFSFVKPQAHDFSLLSAELFNALRLFGPVDDGDAHISMRTVVAKLRHPALHSEGERSQLDRSKGATIPAATAEPMLVAPVPIHPLPVAYPSELVWLLQQAVLHRRGCIEGLLGGHWLRCLAAALRQNLCVVCGCKDVQNGQFMCSKELHGEHAMSTELYQRVLESCNPASSIPPSGRCV